MPFREKHGRGARDYEVDCGKEKGGADQKKTGFRMAF